MGYFLGCKISNILGMPDIPDFFFLGGGGMGGMGVNSRCLVQAYV